MSFDDMRLPDKHRIGEEGTGFHRDVILFEYMRAVMRYEFGDGTENIKKLVIVR